MAFGTTNSASGPPPVRAAYLDDEEIAAFLDSLEQYGEDVDYSEIETKLDAVYDEIALASVQRTPHEASARHDFLRSLVGSGSRIPRHTLAKRMKEWSVPSMKPEKAMEEEQREYMRKLPRWRRWMSWWSVHGPDVAFISVIAIVEAAFGGWQMAEFISEAQYRAAFGWGIVLAKTSAGFLYPTLFFLLLSMCRYLQTFLRRSHIASRFVNWDFSQEFHVKMSIAALCLATLHAIGHLSGSFVYGSMTSRQTAVKVALGRHAVNLGSYSSYVRSLPGWSGLAALSMFYFLALLSMPVVRKRHFELFQVGHLFMYPLIALLMAHGTAALFHRPILGYFLAIPTLFILIERGTRLFLGFGRIQATLTILDADTVKIHAVLPKLRIWKYDAGQYVFLQVPELSFWQWHPFTVSACVDKSIELHIKVEGLWTRSLRDLAHGQPERPIRVGINGPFGAPAQRFYDYSHSILVGSGIGITPFSGILADLQLKNDLTHGGPESISPRMSDGHNVKRTSIVNVPPRLRRMSAATSASDYRRVDFHWTVRDSNNLLWFSSLLNSVYRSQLWHARNDSIPHLDIRIHTHVTERKQDISTHVYRWLLEMNRTDEAPESPLTGLANPTHFGRPDFVKILDAHYRDLADFRQKQDNAFGLKVKVGVFYCGGPVLGEILADRCRVLSTRGLAERTGIQYIFMTEVFG